MHYRQRLGILAPCVLALALAACAPTREAGDEPAGPEAVGAVETEVAGGVGPRDTAKPRKPRPTVTANVEVPADERPDVHAEPAPDLPALDLPALDLIAALRDGFALPRIERDEVAREARWYATHQKYLDRVFERASRYLPHVAQAVRERGMPTEIAFLPVVESAFDPFAYSHGRAAGLWQIIPGTGKRFGLKQNWWYDGRRDVVESTRAALDYLEYLHAEFEGDWLLAIAAYNSGEGNVHRAIRKNRAAGKPTDFWHLSLPRETRTYVPRLLGLSDVIRDPAAHGIQLPVLPDEQYFATVDLDGQVDLALVADLGGLEVEEIYALNPGFNRWATDPDGPHRLQVPFAAAPALAEALAAIPATERVRWERHKVKSGDTLLGLAKTYRTTPAVIREVNGLSGDSIRAGAWLMVPTATRSLDEYSLTASNRLMARQSRGPQGRSKSQHVVRQGESFWSISRKYGVGVRELAAWNGMAPGDTLAVGRNLVVWTNGTPASAAAAGVPGDARVRKVRYTVRSGDSLYRIASNFRVTVNQIRDWNDLHGQKYLKPGQRLVMYVDVTAQSGG